MKKSGIVWLVAGLVALTGCGGSSSSSNSAATNNWQFSLIQEEPRPQTTLPVTGFLNQSKSAISGSMVVPTSTQNGKCGGVAIVDGTIDGHNVAINLNEGGTIINLSGTLSSDGKSMTGSYSGIGGGCFTAPTTGTWSATQVPALNGNFTGTLSNSTYMTLLTGIQPPAPINVTGHLTQGALDGTGSQATITGTINAVGYPCFESASVAGTISGQNVYLLVYGFDGTQIGTIGIPGITGRSSSPATVVADSTGLSLQGIAASGLILGLNSGQVFGPCPPLLNPAGQGKVPYDSSDVVFTFH